MISGFCFPKRKKFKISSRADVGEIFLFLFVEKYFHLVKINARIKRRVDDRVGDGEEERIKFS